MKTSKSVVLSTLLCLIFGSAFTQNKAVIDSFEDENLSLNPRWLGDVSDFQNVQGQLWSASDQSNDYFEMMTRLDTMAQYEWSWDVFLDFSTSSVNYVDLILATNSTCAFVLRIGDTKDKLRLFYRDSANAEYDLASGPQGETHKFKARVKVRLDSLGFWRVEYDRGFSGVYEHLDSVLKQPDFVFAYTGLGIWQSTTSFHRKHHFDNFYAGPHRVDTLPPYVEEANIFSDSMIIVRFSETIDTSQFQKSQFKLSRNQRQPNKLLITENEAMLTFNSIFESGLYHLQVTGVKDASGNVMKDTVVDIQYNAPEAGERFDIIITEVMADPEPVVGLPEAEYLELYNRTNKTINLFGWKLKDETKEAVLDSFEFQPQHFLILCDANDEAVFQAFGEVLGVKGMVSLNNTGDNLELFNRFSEIVFSLHYDDEMHTSDAKREGGWSVEMKTLSPCNNPLNWASSVNSDGGTPGEPNSVDQVLVDNDAPGVVEAKVTGWKTIRLQFNESIALYNPNVSDFWLEGYDIMAINRLSEYSLELVLGAQLEIGVVYALEVSGVEDCAGNHLLPIKVCVAIPEDANAGDVLINEVLFDPPTDGVDFVEIVNVSDNVFDLSSLYMKRDSTEAKALLGTSKLFFPGDYVAVTLDSSILRRQHPDYAKQWFLESKALPILPNREGNVSIVLESGKVIDQFSYSDNMHFELLDMLDGVSLERRSFTDIENNWTSASYAAGYATPGEVNSQFIDIDRVRGSFSISPDPVSPDGDGHNDFLVIRYNTEEAGTNVNVRIFDQFGRQVAFPVNASLAGESNTYVWDGLREDDTRVAPGVYIVHVETLSVQGRTDYYRKGFTVTW